MRGTPSIWKDASAGAGITLLLLAVPLINGFPLVYADTGTYLLSAIDHVVPPDRPYWYGVFLRWTSFGGLSLWGPVIVQSLICAILLLRICRIHVGGDTHRITALIITAVLVAGTGLAWNVGQLMPDIFTAIGVLAMMLLWTDKGGKARMIQHAVLVLVSCWVHSSNLLILTLLAVVLAFVVRDGRLRLRDRWRSVALTCVLAWGGLLLLNRLADGEAYLAKGSHAFLIGRMIDSGMLPAWLDEHCPQEKLALCDYRDALPANSQHFLWDEESPLQRMGGWEATRDEYGRIVRSSLQEPHYLFWHLRDVPRSTARQLSLWTVGRRLQGAWYRKPYSAPYRVIAERLPQHLPAYQASLQNTLPDGGTALLRSADRRYQFTMLCTALLLCAAIAPRFRRRLGHDQRLLLFATLAAVLIDCAVCASLSVADDRFLSRISWLIPLAVMLCIAHLRAHPRAIAS